jgi:hypothetical protein
MKSCEEGSTTTIAKRRIIGPLYCVVTAALLVAIAGSFQCWQSQSVGHHPTETLHDVCLGIWMVSGALLALSQMIFIGWALRIEDSAVPSTDLPPGSAIPKVHASITKVVILVTGFAILSIIAIVIFALSSMPS